MASLAGKVAVITGASSGIGAATARLFAQVSIPEMVFVGRAMFVVGRAMVFVGRGMVIVRRGMVFVRRVVVIFQWGWRLSDGDVFVQLVAFRHMHNCKCTK